MNETDNYFLGLVQVWAFIATGNPPFSFGALGGIFQSQILLDWKLLQILDAQIIILEEKMKRIFIVILVFCLAALLFAEVEAELLQKVMNR